MKENNISVVIFSNTVTPYCVHVERIIKFLGEETGKNSLLLKLEKFPNFLNYEMLIKFKELAKEADLVIATPINYDHLNFHVHGKERTPKDEAVETMKEIMTTIKKGIVIEVFCQLKSYQKTAGDNILAVENWLDPLIEQTIKEIIANKKEP